MQQVMDKAERIAVLNDRLRQTFWGGKVMMTQGVSALPEDLQLSLFLMVAEYDDFTPDNDPYGERNFGCITIAGEKFFWKISLHEERPVKLFDDGTYAEAVYTRVLTIMLAEEY